MTAYNEVKDSHMSIATGDDSGGGSGLTDWLNAKAAYIAGELIPVDQLLGWSNTPPVKTTERVGQLTTSRVKHRYSKVRQLGRWSSRHAFQTAQFCFWLMQTPGTPTTENTPAGYNTHLLTKGTSNTPHWHGIHLEREGITSNELRYDISGIVTSELVIRSSPTLDEQKVTQELTLDYAYLNRSASDIVAQTIRDDQLIGSLWKTWDHLIAGNGVGINPSGLTYNANPLEVDVVGFETHLKRETFIGGVPDTSGYFQVGLMLGWDYWYVLDVKPKGDLLYTVNNTAKEDYAGDLDYDFKFDADTTNDNIRFNNDKLYLVPFDEDNDWDKYLEGYHITLEPFDKDASLTITGIDILNNNHYENP